MVGRRRNRSEGMSVHLTPADEPAPKDKRERGNMRSPAPDIDADAMCLKGVRRPFFHLTEEFFLLR